MTRRASRHRGSRRFFAGIAICTCLTGCDALDFIFEEPPPVPAKHPTHDLVVARGVARFNGVQIFPKTPLSKWVDLFGKPERELGVYYFWDSIGLGAAMQKIGQQHPFEQPVVCLHVSWRPNGSPLSQGKFPGRTLVEGAVFYDGAKVGLVNRQFEQSCEEVVGFAQSALPGSYVCDTKQPPRSYELKVEVYDHAAWVRYLNLCDSSEG